MAIIERSQEKLLNTKEKNTEFGYYFVFLMTILLGIILGSICFRYHLYQHPEWKDELIKKITIIDDSEKEVPYQELLSRSIIKNLKVLLCFWIVGISVVGSPFLLLLCIYKGFKLSFPICTILMKYGFWSGNIIVFKYLFLYTFFEILGMALLTVSSIKLTSHIFHEKKDIKFEMIRHTIVAVISSFSLLISVLLETFLTL